MAQPSPPQPPLTTRALQADALPAFAYSRWVWLATLAAAIYSGVSSQVPLLLSAACSWCVADAGLLGAMLAAGHLGRCRFLRPVCPSAQVVD